MAKRKARGKHPLKGGTNIRTGGPSFIGKPGSGKTTQAGSKRGGKRITKTR